jgi:hypothetical protein
MLLDSTCTAAGRQTVRAWAAGRSIRGCAAWLPGDVYGREGVKNRRTETERREEAHGTGANTARIEHARRLNARRWWRCSRPHPRRTGDAQNKQSTKRSHAGSTQCWDGEQHSCWMSTEGAGHSRPLVQSIPRTAWSLPKHTSSQAASNEQAATRTEKRPEQKSLETRPNPMNQS